MILRKRSARTVNTGVVMIGRMSELDRIDLEILAVIQERGDIRMEDLGSRVNMSPSQASRRLDRLRRDGYIDRIAAILNPERLGLSIKAYLMVGLMPHVEVAHAFHDLVKNSPEIMECSMTTGDTDFLLRVQTRDLKTLRALINALTSTKQVASLKSSIVIEEAKCLTAFPIGLCSNR